jgi:hypothetical protein
MNDLIHVNITQQVFNNLGGVMMERFKWLFRICVCVALLSATSGYAKECARCRLEKAWGLAAQPSDLFDPETMARFDGQVISIEEVSPDKELTPGTYVLLKTNEGNMSVRLGPADYLKRQGFTIRPYDRLEVMGSKVKIEEDRKGIIATKAKSGEKSIALRTPSGKPVWASTAKGK